MPQGQIEMLEGHCIKKVNYSTNMKFPLKIGQFLVQFEGGFFLFDIENMLFSI